MNMSSFKKYIRKTYTKLGEINYSNYWNLGYINALKDNGIINKEEIEALNDYNNKIYLDEETKIIRRK